jgi:hypothetical protein
VDFEAFVAARSRVAEKMNHEGYKIFDFTPRVRSMLLPHLKRLLHARIGKEFHANLALDRPSHHTLQVGPPGYLFRRDTNL